MTKDEIQKQIEQIEVVYKQYLAQLSELKRKQDKILNDFSEVLKNKKLDQLKKQIADL
jgi:hypothetical protein